MTDDNQEGVEVPPPQAETTADAVDAVEKPKDEEAADMKPMAVGDSTGGSKWDNWVEWMTSGGKVVVPRKYQLISDENARQNSLNALRYSVLASAICTKILTPNYPLMVNGEHEDSFPSISPFGVNR